MNGIKFRAKTLGKNPKLIYGYYLYDPIHDRHFILSHDAMGNVRETIIDPETLSRFTGLKSQSGQEIYEGDIVKHPDFVSVVEWNNALAGFNVKAPHNFWNGYSFGHLKVIGNIYENKELLND